MGWNHPEISLEEMVKLIKGFVDIVILAAGHQSSGLPAHWNPHNIKKALHWALFFENVFRHLSTLDDNQESLHELDAILTQIKSSTSFPKGLSHLSSATLSTARAFVSEHLIRALPIRDAHLKAFLKAVVEMDLSELLETEHHCLNRYLDELMLVNSSLNLVPETRGFDKEFIVSSSDTAPPLNIHTCEGDNFTKLAIEGLIKRQSAVSCSSIVVTGLEILSSAIKCDGLFRSNDDSMEEHLKQHGPSIITRSPDDSVNIVTWNQWKSRNLLYFLDIRTVRLISGASMIFSAPTFQWVHVLEQLRTSAKSQYDNTSEIMELMLLGCVASRWSCLIHHFMSVSYDSLSIIKQYRELCKGIPHCCHSKEEPIKSMQENCILEHLMRLVNGQLSQLWKLSPALVAVSIPSWSPLFGLYLREIETQLKGNASKLRWCSCSRDGKDHRDCELGERIWLLYAFHIMGSHLMSWDSRN